MRKLVGSLATFLLMGVPAWVVLAGLMGGGSASLEVRVSDADPAVTVWVDGREFPPGSIKVGPGGHLVRVMRGGETVFTRRVEVGPGECKEVKAFWAEEGVEGGEDVEAIPSLGGDPTRLDSEARVSAVEFGGDGRLAVSADDRGDLRLWDPDDGRAGRVIAARHGMIDRLVVFGGGRSALSAARDGRLRFWDLSTGADVRAVAMAGAGRVVALAVTVDGRLAATGDEHSSVRVIELADGREVFVRRGGPAVVAALAFTPDGGRLVVGTVGEGRGPHPVEVLDVPSGRLVRRLHGHTGSVWGVACLPDGRRAVSVGSDRALQVWDLDGGRGLKRLGGLPGAGRCLAVSADGRHALVGTGHQWSGGWRPADAYGVQVYDLVDGRSLGQFATAGAVCSVALSPDGRRVLAAVEGDSVCSWVVPEALRTSLAARPPAAPALSVGAAVPVPAGVTGSAGVGLPAGSI